MTRIREGLGDLFDSFWKIFSGVEGGRESKGYYSWRDADKRLRDKYMVCTPVDGTPYVVAATTYLDEFGVAEARRERLIKRMIAAAVIVAVLKVRSSKSQKPVVPVAVGSTLVNVPPPAV